MISIRSKGALVFVAACLLSQPAQPQIPETGLIIHNWQVVGPFQAAPRDLSLDYLLPYGGENRIRPTADQVFYSMHPDSGLVRWFSLHTDTSLVQVQYPRVNWGFLDSIYGSRGLINVGYAYAEFDLPENCTALAAPRRISMFYVNGTPYEAEPYSYDFARIPVALRKGRNRILIRFSAWGDGFFGFKLLPARAPVITLNDFTKPDLVVGQKLKEGWLGVTIVNTTRRWATDVELRLGSTKFFRAEPVCVPPIPPLGILKVPFHFSQTRRCPAESTRLALPLTLRQEGRDVWHASALLAVRKPTDVIDVTFLSRLDSSVQMYAVRYPKHFAPNRTYALILALHGAGSSAHGQCAAYTAKDWAFVVAPTNRRNYGFDWQDWGRLDLYEVLALVEKRFRIDSNRIYLSGASMGGQGTWHNGLHDPSRFAALAPTAGWTSFQIYTPFFLQRSELLASPTLLQYRDRQLLDCNNPYFAVNALHLPVVITQGGADDNVPPIHARIYQFVLKDLGYTVKYREIPGKPHWWSDPKVDGVGADCVDNPEIMNFLKAHKRDPFPKEVRFRCVDLSINNRAYWVTVDEQQRVFAATDIHARLRADTVFVQTTNVAQLTLTLDSSWFPHRQVTVVWNGRVFRRHLRKGRTHVTLRHNQNPNPPPALRKTPSLYGPVKAAFFQPFLLVYGTQGRPEETDVLLNNTRRLAIRFWRRANGFARVVPDTALTEAQIRSHNLILIGGPTRNVVTQRVNARLPVRITPDGVSVGEQHLRGRDLAVVEVYPNPLAPEHLVAIFAGTSPKAEATTLLFQPIYSASGVPDFVVFGPEVKRKGWGGVRAAGYFSTTWDLGNGDYEIR